MVYRISLANKCEVEMKALLSSINAELVCSNIRLAGQVKASFTESVSYHSEFSEKLYLQQ